VKWSVRPQRRSGPFRLEFLWLVVYSNDGFERTVSPRLLWQSPFGQIVQPGSGRCCVGPRPRPRSPDFMVFIEHNRAEGWSDTRRTSAAP
jgi:hypothetical protein